MINAGDKPRLCISVGNTDLNGIYAAIDYARLKEAELLEVRFDLIKETASIDISDDNGLNLKEGIADIISYAKKSGIKTIATKRPQDYHNNNGGKVIDDSSIGETGERNSTEPNGAGCGRHAAESDLKRFDFLKNVMEIGADFADIELDASPRHLIYDFVKFAHLKKSKVILSVHNFNEAVSLEAAIQYYIDSSFFSADYFKIADTVKSQFEVINKIDINLNLSKIKSDGGSSFPDFIVFGMGETGKITRILSLIYGSSFAYCSSSSGATAPGQVSVEEFLIKYAMLSNFYASD